MKRFVPTWEPAFIGGLLVVGMMLVASICAQSQAQDSAENKGEEGKVVQIAPGDAADNLDTELDTETRVVEEPSYWIGVQGGSIDSAVLRTHLQLAEDMGVVVDEIIEGSPAAKAGLRKHDIIVRCNGNAVHNMQVLQQQVVAGKDKPLELKIIRLGKQETLVVVPEQRPEEFTGPPRRRELGLEVEDPMQQLLERFGARNIGPGMVFRGGDAQFGLNEIPNGVSVSIQRNNDEPAQITVKQGDKTWQIEGDDPESLQQLPEELRPFVERMLNGNGFGGGADGAFNFGDLDVQLRGLDGQLEGLDAQLRDLIPRGLGNFGPRGDAIRQEFKQREQQLKQQEDKIQQRMRELEQQMKQLQKRFEEGGPALPE